MSGLTLEKMLRVREMFMDPEPPPVICFKISLLGFMDLKYGGWRKMVKRRVRYLRRQRR